MRIRSILAGLAATILFAGSAMAQATAPTIPPADMPPVPPPSPSSAPPAPPPTPEQIAKARADADTVIARFGVSDIFENVTKDNIPTIRHKQSGMICQVDAASPATEIHLYDGLPRGEDVSCNSEEMGVVQTLYATRYPQRPTARDIVADSVRAMQGRFSRMKPYEGPGISMTREGADLPQVTTARFTAVINGRKVYTRTSAVVIGDWVYAQRVTADEKDAMMAEILAELQWMILLLSLTGQDI